MLLKLGEIRLAKINSFLFIELLLLFYICSVIVFSMIPIGNIISKVIGMIFIYYFIINWIIKKDTIFVNREIKIVLIWFVFCILSGIVALNIDLVIVKIITIIQLIFFLIAGYSVLINSKIKIDTLLYLIIISVFAIIVYGFVSQYNPSVLVTKNRITSTAGDPNALSLLGAFAFIFSLYLLQTANSKKHKILLLLSICTISYGIVLTQSRQGILIVVVGIIIYTIIQNVYKFKNTVDKKRYIVKFILYLAGLAGILIVFAYLFQQTEYSYRIQAFIAFIKISYNSSNEQLAKIIDYSAYERSQLLRYGMNIWMDHPILGVGLDNFRAIIKQYNPTGNRLYAHNNYLELLTTIGTFGALVYYAIYASIIAKLLYIQKILPAKSNELKLTQMFLTIILSMMVVDLLAVTYYTKFTWILLLMIFTFSDKILNENQNYHTTSS